MKNPGGRPKFRPTDEHRKLVESLSGYGIPESQIRMLVINPETGKAIAEKTLRAHFRAELDTGFVKANAKVIETLWNQAISGNVAAAIWWSKARLGWSEKVVQEVTGKDGGPIQHEHSARDEIARRISGVAARIGAGGDPAKPNGAGGSGASH